MKGLFYPLAILLFTGCTNEPEPMVPIKDTVIKRDTVTRPPSMTGLAPVDVSPLDISYFPTDYPVAKMSGKTSAGPLARVIYSRPHRQGRKIFGNLLKYGESWRLGANEATEIEFFTDASIMGKRVSKGRYILYCIPEENQWTIRLNTNIYSWGLKLDQKKDIAEFRIGTEHAPQQLEYFTMMFERSDKGANLVMGWDEVIAKLPISFN
jgi:hypothetical protein